MELITVKMGREDWTAVVDALEYLGNFSATPLDATPEHMVMIAESIQDVLEAR